MKYIAVLFELLAIVVLYVQHIDQKSEIFVRLMMYQTKIPIPIWSIFFVLGSVFWFLGSKKSTEIQENKNRNEKEKKAPSSVNSVRTDSSGDLLGELQEDMPDVDIQDLPVEEQEFITMIEEKIKNIHFPSSAKVLIDAKKNIPFTLYCYRSTPQQLKRNIEEFALFIKEIPRPHRMYFQFEQVIESGIPLQNIVRGALQKHINISELQITSQENGIDIRFTEPQEPWISKPNLKRSFV